MGSQSYTMFAVGAQLAGTLLTVVGVFVAFGPYQDDRTWNLMRNSARSQVVRMPQFPRPTHFRLRELQPLGGRGPQPDPRAPPVLFVPGHLGKWTQVINIAAYVTDRRRAVFYVTDFHASVSALHASIIEKQAEFAAEAVRTIGRHYAAKGQPGVGLTLIGHSMGGVVALQALRLLHRSSEGSLVTAVLLISSPVLGHPLLLEPSLARLSQELQREVWDLTPPVVAIVGGDTDPLIPSEVAGVPPGTKNGTSLATVAMQNVFSSFSHVNLLFSRHSLHAINGLVSAALDGRLLEAAAALRPPLAELTHQPEGQLGDGHALPLRDLDSTAAGSLAAAILLEHSEQGKLHLRQAGGSVVMDEPAQFTRAAEAAIVGKVTSWEELLEGRGPHILPGPVGATTFSLLLLERPKPIRRPPETSTRGEDFDPRDRVACGSLASVRVGLLRRRSQEVAWTNVTPLVTQYPAKACLFHFVLPHNEISAAAALVTATKPKEGAQQLVGWAQWHGGQQLEDAWGQSAFPLMSGLTALLWPTTLRLPAGRPVVTRLLLPSMPLAWALPLDLQVIQGLSTPWGLQAILVAAGPQPEEAQVFAQVAAHPPPTVANLQDSEASSVPRAAAWAAESNPDVFTPRFLPGSTVLPPAVSVLADPSQELHLHVRMNGWAMLARCFRTYLGYVLGAWLGATLALQGIPRRVQGAGSVGWLAAWVCCSTLVVTLLPHHLASEPGIQPGAPPTVLVAFMHALGALLACAGQLVDQCVAGLVACLRRHKQSGARPRWTTSLVLEFALWLVLAAFHPAGSLLALRLRAVLQLGAESLLVEVDAKGSASAAAEAQEWLLGLCSTLWLFILSHMPSLILTVWVLLGQHHEASTAQLHNELQESLRTSSDAPSAWVDSLVFASDVSPLPALGVVAPAVAVACHCACARNSCTPLRILWRAQGLARLIFACLSLGTVAFIRHRTHHLRIVTEAALCLHAAVALVAVFGSAAPYKSE